MILSVTDQTMKVLVKNELHQCNAMHQCNAAFAITGQVKFVEVSLEKIWSDMVCLGRPYQFKFFRGCLSQFLLGPFLNTLTHITNKVYNFWNFEDILEDFIHFARFRVQNYHLIYTTWLLRILIFIAQDI